MASTLVTRGFVSSPNRTISSLAASRTGSGAAGFQQARLTRPAPTRGWQGQPQFSAMAFPAQKQDRQPGLEHEMDPKPSVTKPTYKPADKLKGKSALITGGDSGIGRAVAVYFAMEGANVAFTYLKDEEKDAMDVVAMIKEDSVQGAKEPLALCANVGEEGRCKELIEEVVNHFGGLDILVNNAAEQHTHETLEEVTTEEWERTFRTNIHSMFWLCKYGLPHMKEGSSIINSASVNAYKGNSSLIGYSTTKGAIIAFTRSLALSIAGRGIRVNAVAPGPVWTPLIVSTFTPEKVENFGSHTPMGRAGQPDEIATSYVFLASQDSSFFTGQCLHPNGGTVVNA